MTTPTVQDAPFIAACFQKATPITPVWLMRQAGRYMKEYRDLRARHSFLELCRNPELACEVTVYAVERIKADAAIIFSDILLILESLGLKLKYTINDGPEISGKIQTCEDVKKIPAIDSREALSYVMDAIKLTRQSLNPKIPLIGFSGAPFTLASYILEGGSSRTFEKTKSFMRLQPEAWHLLMNKLSGAIHDYLMAQVEAGADAVQLFDSWVGCLTPEEYENLVLPHSKKVFENLPDHIPQIHFGTGTGPFIKQFRSAGGQVLGLDQHVSISDVWKTLNYDCAVQGNLDPKILFESIPTIRTHVEKILSEVAGRPGHIFNLGHGVLQHTPVENVIALVDMVHEITAKKA